MLKRALVAGLLLWGCSPQKAPEEPQAPAAQAEPAQPAALAADEIPAPAGEITVTAPMAGAKLTSPITVGGTVINTWMFEGVFPVDLAVDGEVIAQAPGQQQAPDNWTNPGPVRFKATLTFTVTKETPAVLILKEDAPRPKSSNTDEEGPARTLRIPVVLMPAT